MKRIMRKFRVAIEAAVSEGWRTSSRRARAALPKGRVRFVCADRAFNPGMKKPARVARALSVT
jgi:hypothetical protein